MSRSASAAVLSSAPRTRQVRLTGTSPGLDPRANVYRPDLADISLAGRVAAAHYAEPMALVCTAPTTALRSRPSDEAIAVSELLLGETFTVFEISGGWAWGQCEHDSYVGYARADAFGPPQGIATHRVIAPQGLVFSEADIKSPLRSTLPLNARVAVADTQGRFHALGSGGFVHDRHVAPVGCYADDMFGLAHEFLGTPYLWGGRTRAGIDCSGLVQTVLIACGHPCPRDTDQQRATVGVPADASTTKRGDLVFFPGHVGIMASDTDLLHANAFWMNTVIEPLADVIDRLRPDHPEPVLAVRRLTSA